MPCQKATVTDCWLRLFSIKGTKLQLTKTYGEKGEIIGHFVPLHNPVTFYVRDADLKSYNSYKNSSLPTKESFILFLHFVWVK